MHREIPQERTQGRTEALWGGGKRFQRTPNRRTHVAAAEGEDSSSFKTSKGKCVQMGGKYVCINLIILAKVELVPVVWFIDTLTNILLLTPSTNRILQRI